MRTLTVIIILALLFNCNNAVEDSNKDIFLEEASSEISIEDIKISSPTEFTIVDLSQQKLQEVYDLTILKRNYPEFEEDITNSLHDLIIGDINFEIREDSIKIRNVEQIRGVDSDNVEKNVIYIRYDLIAEKFVKTDTIAMIMHTQKSIVNGDSISTYKLKLKKI